MSTQIHYRVLEGDTAQMVGFLIIAGSVVMFALMIIFGSFWIVSGMGSGLGGSEGSNMTIYL